MVIPPNHPVVDTEGVVTIPYLTNWRGHTHNLSVALAIMASEFGEKPPVRARPTNQVPRQAQRQPPRVMGTGGPPVVVVGGGGGGSSGARPPPSYDSLQGGVANGHHQQRGASPVRPPTGPEGVKRAAIDKVQEKVQRTFLVVRTAMDDEFRRQAKLEKRRAEVAETEARLEEKREALRAAVEKAEQAEAFLRSHLQQQADEDGEGGAGVEDHLTLQGEHAEQLLGEVAMAQACEDALYILDRALTSGAIEIDAFQRGVRKVSRKQFMHRALALKIQGIQAGEARNSYNPSPVPSPSPTHGRRGTNSTGSRSSSGAPPSYNALMGAI
mmetsp:Transcript_9959/g.29288  ORF Transcript_9959/g.29288 Transcript_9959/m.29288 type:complete len:327 (-) Transcript_9959:1137-2117(-)